MKNIILFEIKKILKSKINIIAILFSVIVLIGYIYINNSFDKKLEKNKLSEVTIQIEELNTVVKGLKKDDTRIDTLEEIIENLKFMKVGLEQNDNKLYIESKVKYNESRVKLGDSEIFSNFDYQKFSNEIEEYKKLIELDIKPINKEYSMTGYNFIRLSLNAPLTIVFTLMIFVFISNSISGEFDNKTYKILFLQPISKSTIFFSKFIALISVVLTTISTIFITSYLVIYNINGSGSDNYPIKTLINNEYSYIPIKEFVFKELWYFLIYIIFICIFAILVCILINQISTSLSVCSIIALCIYIITFKLRFGKVVAKYSPFSLMEISLIQSGKLVEIYGYKDYSISSNIIVAIVLSIILLVVSIIYFNRKESYN